ncbi:MAG: T9SS type A sorting domain-containing protein, partial [Calditrichota bacterium]
ITTHSFLAETDNQGNYIIDNILIGEDYSITASAQGWNDSTLTGFDVVEDQEVVVNFSLLHPEFVPSVEFLQAEIPVGQRRDLPFRVTNTGNGPLQWRIERRLRGDADAEPWEMRGSYNISQTLNDPRIQGAAFIGDLFYVTGSNNQHPVVYIINREGEEVGRFDQHVNTNYGIYSLAWDGELLWGSGERTVYGFTPEGDWVRQFDGQFNPNNNLAWDSDRNILWVNGVTTDITGYDRDGNLIRILNRRNLRVYGLAYWPEDPDGFGLYIFHSPAASEQWVHKMNPDNNDTTFVTTLQPQGGGRPSSAFITNQFDVYSWVFVDIANNAANDRIDIWQLGARKDWMRPQPVTGVTNAGQRQDFVLTLDATGLPVVPFEGDLVFIHNAAGGETAIPVTLDVSNPPGEEEERVLNLRAGWNMISLNVQPEVIDIVELMRPLTEAGALVMMKNGAGQFYRPAQNFNNIPGWVATEGYQMNLNREIDFAVRGVVMAPDHPVPLHRGWNIAAYMPRIPMEARAALANIRENLEIAKDAAGKFYLPAFDFSNMGNLIEGQGYQIKVTQDVELVYNLDQNAGVDVLSLNVPEPTLQYLTPPASTGSNMSLLLFTPAALNGEIGVFSEGNLVGAGMASNGVCPIAVWGDNPLTEIRDGASEGGRLEVRWVDASGHQRQVGLTTLAGSDIYRTDDYWVARIDRVEMLPERFGIQRAYPNPFNGALRLEYGLLESAQVELALFDLNGRLVQEIERGVKPAGIHLTVVDGSSLAAGVYIARLRVPGQESRWKVTLIK